MKKQTEMTDAEIMGTLGVGQVFIPRPKGEKCPKCGMSKHKPDRFCAGKK